MSIIRTFSRLRQSLRPSCGIAQPLIDSASARVPDHCRVYAIGDIHGRVDLLRRLLDLIERDVAATQKSAVLVFVGDYIDRGDGSREVINVVLDCVTGFDGTVVTLMGNHEEALLSFLEAPAAGAGWMHYGGAETLLSYRVSVTPGNMTAKSLTELALRFSDALPPEHYQFFQNLQDSYVLGDYFFAHAGIRPKRKLDAQVPSDLRWIREEFLEYEGLHPKVVVHGHTVCDQPAVTANRIGIDTGAYFSGHLTCVVLDGQEIRFIQT